MTHIASSLLAASLSDDEVQTLFLILALLCLCGAAYTAWKQIVPATVLLVFVAVIAVFIGLD